MRGSGRGTFGETVFLLGGILKEKQFLLLLWPLSGPGGGQPVFTVPLKSVPVPGPQAEDGLPEGSRWSCWDTGGPSPLRCSHVSGLHVSTSRGTVNTYLVLGCGEVGGAGAERSPDAGWSSRRVSFSYLSRVRILSWPLRAQGKHLSPMRVRWVYIFIPLRTGLGYTFFLR